MRPHSLVLAFSLTLVAACAAAAPSPADSGSAAAAPPRATRLAATLVGMGLENVSVAGPDSLPLVTWENRRWRHTLDAFGRVERAVGGRVECIEERDALPAAALRREDGAWLTGLQVVVPPGAPSLASGTLLERPGPPETRFEVLYPCDPGFPRPPQAPLAKPTWRSVDLVLNALFDYELGRVFDPVLYRIQLEPTLRYTPWPGALTRLAIDLPVTNNFEPDIFHPDAGHVRPGPMELEQFAWVPMTGLLSLTGGYFGDNRYGGSAGMARPLAGGRVLLDGQIDLTGFVTFGPAGTQYSPANHWTGFGAVAWKPGLDLTVRARAARFLFGDHGVELELRRSMGDVDIAFFGQHAGGDNVAGVRLTLPVPPLTRAAGGAVRAQPVERFKIDYHTFSALVGRDLTGTASREDYLRQLDVPALQANLDRYRRARGEAPPARADEGRTSPPASDLVNWTGMTGFINTPWAGVMPDRRVEAGYTRVPKKWAYDHRGQYDNEVAYATLGFLPRLETALRITRIPGLLTFSDLAPESRLVDTDYMGSARLCLAPPAVGRPGLSVGIEDAKGTRRFHSTYAVTGLPYSIEGVQGRVSMGYAFRVLKANRRILDGAFGALEVSPWRPLAVQVEYDTEKWNAAVALRGPLGIRIRAALLHMESASFGFGWGVPL